MTQTRNLVLLLVAALLMIGCSSRRAYQLETDNVALSPGAVNINVASADELEKLPNIGRKTAEAIVQFREKNGPFRRPEHLMQIRGISEQRFLEMRQFLRAE